MFIDAVEIADKPRITKDGYLVANARVARTGIQLYTGAELGIKDKDVIRVYRPEAEVFSKDSLASFVGKPMTDDHPQSFVDAKSWKDEAIGSIGEGVLRDGEHIKVPLIMMDAAAIEKYNSGKRELSMGYDADLEFTAGVTDSGEAYDAIQKNIRINHIALVEKGRAGSARIGDKGGHGNSSKTKPEDKSMVKVKVGDVTIEVSEQAAEAIKALSEKVKEAEAKAEAAEAEAAEAADKVAAQDKELATKDAEIEKLKASQLDAAGLDAAINERVELIGKARKIADVDYSGQSVEQIRKTAVEAVLGVDSMKDRSAAYIEARFDALQDSKPQLQRQQQDGGGNVASIYDAYEAKFNKQGA